MVTCSLCSEFTSTDNDPKAVAATHFSIISSVTRLSRHAEAPTCPVPFGASTDSVSNSAFALLPTVKLPTLLHTVGASRCLPGQNASLEDGSSLDVHAPEVCSHPCSDAAMIKYMAHVAMKLDLDSYTPTLYYYT